MATTSEQTALDYLVLSDIHLNHDRNKSENIVANLFDYFDGYSDKSRFTTMKMIAVAGDLTDKLMDAANQALYDTFSCLTSILKFCKRHGIIFRWLEGTPFHERNQGRILDAIKEMIEYAGNARWVKTLEIEYLTELGLHILYVPDEYMSATSLTQIEVARLLKEKGLEKVDIAIMHGVFNYQMAGIPGKHDTHDEEYYLSIVKHFINIGHHHQHTSYERIVSQGSFDRLAHGEEKPKGAVVMTIDPVNGDHFEFVENTKAMKFVTVHVTGNNMDTAFAQLDRVVSKLPSGSHLRLKAKKLHPLYQAFDTLRKRYSFLHLSKLSEEDEELERKAKVDSKEVSYNVVEITNQNVVPLLLEEVQLISDLTAEQTNTLKQLLESITI